MLVKGATVVTTTVQCPKMVTSLANLYIDCLVEDGSKSNALALDLLQFCTKLSIYFSDDIMVNRII